LSTLPSAKKSYAAERDRTRGFQKRESPKGEKRISKEPKKHKGKQRGTEEKKRAPSSDSAQKKKPT